MRNAQIADSQAVVYWCAASGELMLAPDTRMRPFVGWRRFECKTTAEIEQFSRRMAAQQFQKFRSMKVEEHLRSQRKRDELKANCRLRLASGCISAEDERMTRQTLESCEKKDRMLYQLLYAEPDLSRGSLVIEQFEEEKILSTGKRRGLADEDVNVMGQLAETVA